MSDVRSAVPDDHGDLCFKVMAVFHSDSELCSTDHCEPYLEIVNILYEGKHQRTATLDIEETLFTMDTDTLDTGHWTLFILDTVYIYTDTYTGVFLGVDVGPDIVFEVGLRLNRQWHPLMPGCCTLSCVPATHAPTPI